MAKSVQTELNYHPKNSALEHGFKKSTEEIALHLFSTLKTEQVRALYNLYKIDFEMFGYDAQDYIKIAT